MNIRTDHFKLSTTQYELRRQSGEEWASIRHERTLRYAVFGIGDTATAPPSTRGGPGQSDLGTGHTPASPSGVSFGSVNTVMVKVTTLITGLSGPNPRYSITSSVPSTVGSRAKLPGLVHTRWCRHQEEPLATIRNVDTVTGVPVTQAGDQSAYETASGTDSLPAVEWDWFAAERVAISVAGGSDNALDDVHTILIHLREKVPGSSVHRSALVRGVSSADLWHDTGFISGVRAIAANKLTDIRRAATRRRQPRFRRPNGPSVGPEVWRRYPPYFLIVSPDAVAEGEPQVMAAPELPDTDRVTSSRAVEQAESDHQARQVVRATLRGLRPSDVETLDFALLQYTPLIHENRVDEALAAHRSQKGSRTISRYAARRRLTDARIRLEDAIVGQHRQVLLGTLQQMTAQEIGYHLRSALLAYLGMVGTRPREVVVDATFQTLRATVDPFGRAWPNRPALVSAVATGLRQLYDRHQALWGGPFFSHSGEMPLTRGVPK